MFITGESYGGLYVPYLAWHIYLNNVKADIPQTGLPKYNLKGFIVANGVTDVFSDWTSAVVENLFRFNLIPEKWFKGVEANNCGGEAGAFPDQVSE